MCIGKEDEPAMVKLQGVLKTADCAGQAITQPKLTAVKVTIGTLGGFLRNGIADSPQQAVDNALDACADGTTNSWTQYALIIFWIIVAVVGFCFLLVILMLYMRSKNKSSGKNSTLDLLKLVV